MGAVQQMLLAATAQNGAAYRYWRLYMTATQGGGAYATVAEVELRGTVGGADITTTSTPVTTSSNDPGSVGANTVANDGDTTRWISAQFQSVPSWLLYDLSTPASVLQVAILPWAGLPSNSPSIFTLQGSPDGTSFTDVKTFNAAGWAAGVWQTFNV
jgi:hypothetical protein